MAVLVMSRKMETGANIPAKTFRENEKFQCLRREVTSRQTAQGSRLNKPSGIRGGELAIALAGLKGRLPGSRSRNDDGHVANTYNGSFTSIL